jgi:hypothetical protein
MHSFLHYQLHCLLLSQARHLRRGQDCGMTRSISSLASAIHSLSGAFLFERGFLVGGCCRRYASSTNSVLIRSKNLCRGCKVLGTI